MIHYIQTKLCEHNLSKERDGTINTRPHQTDTDTHVHTRSHTSNAVVRRVLLPLFVSYVAASRERVYARLFS